MTAPEVVQDDGEALAREIHRHESGATWDGCPPCLARSQAILRSDWLAQRDAEVAATALEQAADEMSGGERHHCFRPQGCVECGRREEREGREQWLRHRAARLRATGRAT